MVHSGAASIASMPDDSIIEILRGVPLNDRLRSVALVSRRLRALVNSPTLFNSVAIDLRGHRTAQRVKALPLWLHRHIRPVHCMAWRGMQRLEGPQAPQSDKQHEVMLTNTALTTTAAVAARLCSLHIVLDVPLLTLAWLPMLATTLERLIIGTRRHSLPVDACLGSMTALSHLSLTVSSISLSAGVKLPPRLTSVRFVATGPTVALPRQVLDLSRLVKLCLGQVLVADELPALGPTATDLSFILCTGPAWLAKNTQLQRLHLVCQTVQSVEVDSGLSALAQLTCLMLSTRAAPTVPIYAPSEALSRLTNLHKLYVACDLGTPYGLGQWLHTCTWLANLRWLCASVMQFAFCHHALSLASSLHRVSLFHSAAEASFPASLENIQKWGCCFRKLHSTNWCPRLERVDLIVRPGAPALPDSVNSDLLELQRKRPSVLISRVGATSNEEGCLVSLGFID